VAMKIVAIIPARYASTRLPGKPLLAATGKPLIQYVVDNARAARRVQRVVVATDDERIQRAVQGFGGEAVMTRSDHRCGTDRIAEAAGTLALAEADLVLNVQGDEPELPSRCLDALIDLMDRSDAPMGTLATPLPARLAGDPNKVKVVLARDGKALYFSRARIPHERDDDGTAGYLLHHGVYAFRVGFLKRLSSLPQTAAEKAEKLEQLRALEHGYDIAVATVEHCGTGIDTPADYAEFVKRAAGR